LFEAAPDNETLKRLMRSVNTTIGREKRKKAKRDIKKDIIGQGETPLKLTGHVAAQAKLAGVLLWGGMVNGAKTARRMSDRTLNKRNVIIGSAIAAACVGLDMGGAGNDFTDAVSGLTGGSIAASATAATFLNFNFWEDIVGVHLGTGISLIFGGAAVGFAHKKYIKPAMNYAAETKVGGAFNQARSFAAIRARSGMDAIGGRVDDYNTRLGHKVTQVAREYLSVTEYELG